MTNAEKFKEVFGFNANTNLCYMPEDIKCPLGDCDSCPYNKWLEEEYTGASPTVAGKEYKIEVITRGNCMICGKELTDGLFFCKECEDKEVQDADSD